MKRNQLASLFLATLLVGAVAGCAAEDVEPAPAPAPVGAAKTDENQRTTTPVEVKVEDPKAKPARFRSGGGPTCPPSDPLCANND